MEIQPTAGQKSLPASGPARITGARKQADGRNLLPEYDIITIGGGINGSGIARDAAERGLKVLLLEKDDFGGATSAHNSRLIHGGLRYLENFEVSLVHESLQERELLLKNAPHLVKPLMLGIPAYSYAKLAILKTGMVLYDILSSRLLSFGKRKHQDPRMENHRTLGKNAFSRMFPGVRQEGLVGGVTYFDAQVESPERICVENAIAAQETGNATVLNHAKVNRIETQPVKSANQEASQVTFTDLLTGEKYTAKGKVIINAAGPWVDEVVKLSTPVESDQAAKQKMGGPSLESVPSVRRRIGGTKGSHIVVNRFPGGPGRAMYVEAQSDGRPFFILPWRNFYLIGTTDLHYKGDLDKVVADRDEVAYLLKETNHILPQANLQEKDVLYTYSGVRPLPYAGDKKAGKITRKHIIEDHANDTANPHQGFISIIGGKLTTYRNLAEEAVDYAVEHFKLSGAKPVTTRETPLPGGKGISDIGAFKREESQKASAEYQVSPETVTHLIDLYGSRYRNVLDLTKTSPALKQPLSADSPDIAAQVIYAVRNELAATLTDVMQRRLSSGLDADLGLDAAERAAQLMGHELGWPPEKTQAELSTYQATVKALNLGYLADRT